MIQRERANEGTPRPQDAPPPAGSGNLNAARASASALLAAGDAAINKALSGDSEKFNESVRQDGGQ
ncbi:MAG: hypothetical protein NT105_23400 [Verrucomicrobia bacterium]|nr:hypothetical protein [Verrucomicrobiota bacterium]